MPVAVYIEADFNMFRRFITRYDFDQLTTTSPTPPQPELIQWRSLEIGAVFRVLNRVIIPAVEGDKMYAVLETERREIIQVWITPIMNKELMKYDLSQGNVFIKPLGKRTSNTTGHEYFHFAVVIDC